MSSAVLLSNGRYRTRITASGSGFSSLGDILLTRWTADHTREAEGWFLYLRDLDSGLCWSAGHQPVQHRPDRYEVRFADNLIEIVREDAGIEVRTEITVSPDSDVEWRRYTIRNLDHRVRRIDLTTAAEVVLNTAAVDLGHPAFSKLFVQTEYLRDSGAILARRRPRSPDEVTLYLAHGLFGEESIAQPPEYETDRMRFIGRGRTLANPVALTPGARLSGTVGNVLDPMLALRRQTLLEPGASARFHAVFAAGMDRSAVELAIEAAAMPEAAECAFASTNPLGPATTFQDHPGERFRPAAGVDAPGPDQEALQFFNGHGGFNLTGDEYVIRLDRTPTGLHRPPLPWTNVIANPTTGCVVSESGLGFTWNGNSRLNRLTPWFNDPVSDPAGEAIYLRDDERKIFWSPTPAPVPGAGSYEVRHGFGYTSWRHHSTALDQEVICFVPGKDPVKIVRLRITNREQAPRRLSVFWYAELVLGGHRAETAASVTTEAADDATVVLARNPERPGFEHNVAFASMIGAGDGIRSMTADRESFLGRYGSPEHPAALRNGTRLNGRTQPGLDPCAAFQHSFTLAPEETREWTILLGEAEGEAGALTLCRQYADPGAVAASFEDAVAFWRRLVRAVRVNTPSPEMDLMLNGWLTYQNLSCRMWARSAFYQSGGAFGFRDQLQDAAALLLLAPGLTRDQILLHAAHQFYQGDVLHWWHPPASLGIRTRFSDDLLWLPYVTVHYVATTGDASVLDEELRLLDGCEVPPNDDLVLLVPEDSGSAVDVYEHCCLALDRSLTRGAHGLPLMGSGDWNDGMDRVGRLGLGESVWLGFFLYAILERFIPLCRARGDGARVEQYQEYRSDLATALNTAGWDGEWYRRAYYDDGTPLGSAQSDECRIDLIAQAWSVLSGAATEARAGLALDALERHLVDEPTGLIRLLTPPFDHTSHDPGYIKGYLPGVRENGGQYTHGALWAVRALAEAGRADRALRLFEMLTPVRRSSSTAAVEIYKTEPYVVAADVYGVAPHLGRGGWTWYTGSAGWMFRVGLESILGLTVEHGHTLVLCPCIPPEWPGYTVHYGAPPGDAVYEIIVRKTHGPTTVRAGGLTVRVADRAIRIGLVPEGRYRVEVELGDDVGPRYRARAGEV